MTVLYVDLEHERVLADPARAKGHLARREAGRARLAEAAGEGCDVVRFTEVSRERLEAVGPTAVVISGSTTDWAEYDPATLEPLVEAVRAAPVPILGICAGHQLIGRAHGAAWGPLGPLAPGEADPDPRFAPGQRKERGFLEVRLDTACPLFRGLESRADVFQSHYWHLVDVPEGFLRRASSPWSPVQALERLDRPVFGVQFHPERYDQAHPAGLAVLRNFFEAARGR
ncbi:MAG TPA: gamma-glutamyl-gamma-aminobutyrate hydrolase family protein [Thermodesulfobacteriota bacterium]